MELSKLQGRWHEEHNRVTMVILYNKSDEHCSIRSILCCMLESVQYSAALAVTGAWRGTSREKLYNELGWESLNLRRWSRRLALFFKIVNNLTPEYTRQPIPPLPQSNYRLRRPAIFSFHFIFKYLYRLQNFSKR